MNATLTPVKMKLSVNKVLQESFPVSVSWVSQEISVRLTSMNVRVLLVMGVVNVPSPLREALCASVTSHTQEHCVNQVSEDARII